MGIIMVIVTTTITTTVIRIANQQQCFSACGSTHRSGHVKGCSHGASAKASCCDLLHRAVKALNDVSMVVRPLEVDNGYRTGAVLLCLGGPVPHRHRHRHRHRYRHRCYWILISAAVAPCFLATRSTAAVNVATSVS